MTQILALQLLDVEQEESLYAPCFSIAGSTITVHTM
jgi:hypothetical protein